MSEDAADSKHVLPESEKEGDIDDDRQDPPRPEKPYEQLDGTKATPGDDADQE